MGEVDVDRMLASIPARLFAEWMAYFALEPLGETRADYHTAQIVAALYNLYRDPKKRRQPFAIEEFLLRFERPQDATAVAENAEAARLALFERLKAALGLSPAPGRGGG